MLILGDESHDRGKLPWVTFTLIALNMLVGCIQIRFGDRFTNAFALVPREITEFRDITGKQSIKIRAERPIRNHRGRIQRQEIQQTHSIQHFTGPFPIVLTLFTYMFLHGNFFHFLFNMWFLAIFGRNVECALDHGRYIFFYIVCGVLAGLSQVGADYRSIVPIIGASGAIAGVMGAYLAIFPFNKIKVWVGGWIGLMAFGVIELPAFMVVGTWFLGQYVMGVLTMDMETAGGTAYWSHIGGFVAGFCIIKGLVIYLQYQINKFKEESGEEEEVSLPDDALKAPDVPTQEQVEAMLDPVEAFKKARAAVFRNTEENDPFLRASPDEPQILKAELVEEPELAQAVTTTPLLPTRTTTAPRPKSGGSLGTIPLPTASEAVAAGSPKRGNTWWMKNG